MQKKKKIAVVSDSVLPFNKGGKETRIDHICQELLKQGHEVDIYTMKWWVGGKDIELNGIKYHALSRLYPLYAGDRRSIKQGVLFGIACLGLVRYDFDILDVDHMPFFPIYFTKLVSIIKRRPLYATWHEVWGQDYWFEYLGGWKARLAYWIERLSVKLPDHIATISNHTAQQLRTTLSYTGPLTVVGIGIDYNKIALIKPSPQTSDIIYAGRLLSHKNVNLLIYAVAKMTITNPQLSCLIIGEGPEANRLAALIIDLGMQANVTMLGRVESHDQVFAHMKASRVFVLPSVREGFGITVLEAFACGLRVVTVNHPSNASQYLVTAENGLVCAPDVDSLQISIETLLHAKVDSVGSGVMQHDWSQAASPLPEVYLS